MPRHQKSVPSYCHHKASGQAVVRLDGIDHYLGPYGSQESHQAYERAIGEWRARRAEKVLVDQAISALIRHDQFKQVAVPTKQVTWQFLMRTDKLHFPPGVATSIAHLSCDHAFYPWFSAAAL